MYGKIISTNSKRSIQLPKYMDILENDELLFLKIHDLNIILSKDSYIKLIDYLKNKWNNTTDLDEKEKIKRQIFILKRCVLDIIKCKENREITLQTEIKDNRFICKVNKKVLYLIPVKQNKNFN